MITDAQLNPPVAMWRFRGTSPPVSFYVGYQMVQVNIMPAIIFSRAFSVFHLPPRSVFTS